MNHAILIVVCLTAFYIGEFECGGPAPPPSPQPNGYKCCDQSKANYCKCSNQTGGVGICMCSPSSPIRENWLCVNDKINGDSVSEYVI
jgi:hypothetical protein